jgi:hypothetical protein
MRGGSGLGDALYVRVIAEHFIRSGEAVTACSDQPDAFIGSGAVVEPFRRDHIDVVAHYTMGKSDQATNQWQDVCNSAGVKGVQLRIDWTVRNQTLVERVRAAAAGRRIVIVHGGRAPMGRTDGFGAELLPTASAFDAALGGLDDCFLVRVGKGQHLYQVRAHLDLSGATSVPDLLDLASICDGIVGQCSFVVPLAECFDKPLLAIWAAKGLDTGHPYTRQITPRKVLSKPSSSFVMDDWPAERIRNAARAWLSGAGTAPERTKSERNGMKFVNFDEVGARFRGKTVAIVGSAPSCLDNAPGFVDAHDVVVRVNCYKTGGQQGHRTDVHYSFYGSSIDKDARDLQRDGVTLCMCKCPDSKALDSEWHERHGKQNGIDFRYIYRARAGWWWCDTYVPSDEQFLEKFNILDRHIPTTGFAAILDVLACDPASVYLTGFDFFASKVHNVNEPWRAGNPQDPIRHMPELEADWLANNENRYPIRFDAKLSAIIRARRAAMESA